MSLRVNTNVEAFNAHRNLSSTSTALSKSMEKLSSGLRINRAADDAAGLAISEGMRAQIRGTQQASRNAQDGRPLPPTRSAANRLQRSVYVAVHRRREGHSASLDRQSRMSAVANIPRSGYCNSSNLL